MDATNECSDATVHLMLLDTTTAEGELRKSEHHDIHWISSCKIPNYEFCPADEELLTEITKRF